ncbi:MAG: PepSY domain-containing protein [Oscillospiraceae bacterium]|nr:PepSY domain-containing protein [Oscillospiraceae bacterium]
MKKILIFLLGLLLALSLAACQQPAPAPEAQTPPPADPPSASLADSAGNASIEPADIAFHAGNLEHLQGARISPAQAVAAALLHAQVAQSAARDVEVEARPVGCSVYYEVSFEHGGFEYEYFVHPYSGEAFLEEKEPNL